MIQPGCLMMVAVSSCLLGAVPAPAETVCAVIGAPGSTVSSRLADLLEPHLAGVAGIRLVDRTALEAVLNEQVLSAAFKAEGTRSRLELGRLVKAELLVFLRDRRGKDQKKGDPLIELTVAETKRGLRLAMERAIWNPEQAETLCEAFASTVQHVLELVGRNDLRVFAVSPFESRDLGFEYEHLRRGYARLVEEYLVHLPGVAVVELAEADALAREVALSATAIQRDLPYYFFGSYKTLSGDGGKRVGFAVELRHGSEVMGKAERADRPPEEVGQALQSAIGELVAQVTGRPSAGPAAALETRILADRGDVFRHIGEWDEALPLYQSALLLDPNNLRAHHRMFDGHTELMISLGQRKGPARGEDSAAMRMQHAELALDHLEPLLRAGDLSEDLPRRMSYYRQYCHLAEFRKEEISEGVVAAYQRVCRRWTPMVLELLADENRRSRLTEAQAERLVHFVLYGSIGQARFDPEPALDMAYRLIEVLDKPSELRTMIYIAASMGWYTRGIGSAYDAFLDQLDQSGSSRIRLVGQVTRLLRDIKDHETADRISAELDRFVSSNGLGQDVKDQIGWVVEQRRQRVPRPSPSPETAPSSETVPTLTALDEDLTVARSNGRSSPRPSRINDWLSCGPGPELLATDRGVFRLSQGPSLVEVDSHPADRLHWDGKYVWALDEGSVVVLDPSHGEVARFDQSSVTGGDEVSRGCLATIRPGEACFVGCLERDRKTLRTWAMLLRVKMGAGAAPETETEVFYEARGRMDHGNRATYTSVETAFRPAWALTVPDGGSDGGPLVIVGRSYALMSTPLVLDVSRKTARVPQPQWPWAPLVLAHEGKLYIAAGRLGNYRQSSALHLADHPDHEPKVLIDFGERDSTASPIYYSSYYSAMVVFDHKLHLLADCAPRSARRSAWCAVDLNTGQASCLLDTFPKDFKRGDPERLCVSNRYGLVLLSGGKACQVELPPAETWPPLEAEVQVKKEVPTTAGG